MNINVNGYILRKPEPYDVESLYKYRNDPYVIKSLGGFAAGFSRKDLLEWVDRQCKSATNKVWIIADKKDQCIGHCGLYDIDMRVRSAEFGICLASSEVRGNGIGTEVTRAVMDYGFKQLNLNRSYLFVLVNNVPAISMYNKVGFKLEGTLREHQFRDGKYIDVLLMGILQSEWERRSESDEK